jgi:hypothetical protein
MFFLPTIRNDKRRSPRPNEPTARIQAMDDKGDRLIDVHPFLSAVKNPCLGQFTTNSRSRRHPPQYPKATNLDLFPNYILDEARLMS